MYAGSLPRCSGASHLRLVACDTYFQYAIGFLWNYPILLHCSTRKTTNFCHVCRELAT